MNRLAQEDATFLQVCGGRGCQFLRAGSGWYQLVVPMAIGHKHDRGSQP